MLENVMQMKFEHLIHMKEKSEHLIYKRRSLNVLVCGASKSDADEALTFDPYEGKV